MDFIPYTSQTLFEEDIDALKSTLKSSWITRGPQVDAFEKALSAYCDVPYTVVFSSGTLALEAASYALDIQKEDHLFASPNTFVGTLAGALKHSSNLHFLDLEPQTKSPDFLSLPHLPSKSRAILFPVHFSGMAKKINKPRPHDGLIEDACQAFGARYPSGEKVGSCPTSDLTVFSFHPAKTLCMGEGGAVTTKNEALYKRLLLFRNNGIVKQPGDLPWIYEVEDLTTNANVTDFAAALGLSQLKRVDHFLSHRRKCVERYREKLSSHDYITMPSKEYDLISCHNLFPVEIDFASLDLSREFVMKELFSKGIGTQVHFIPLYRHPYFQKHFSFSCGDFPNQESYYSKALSLPLYSHLEMKQIDFVCTTLKSILSVSLKPSRL